MAIQKFTFAATEKFILVMYMGKRTQITKSDNPERFEKLRALLKSGNEDEIIKAINGDAHMVEEHSSGQFIIDRQNKKIIDKETQTEVGIVLGKRIVEWYEKGLPFEPLLKFHRRIIENPSKESAGELYEFLEKNKIPITQDGNFIGYKKVTKVNGKLRDSHTKTIDNSIGNIVRMSRDRVDPNRRNECSYGLHIGAWGYVNNFSGDTMLECEIDPAHVVAVPRDYNSQKMRVCEYKILRAVNGRKEEIQVPLVNVNKVSVGEDKIAATVDEGKDFSAMTAQQIKDYIWNNYNIQITTDNKNKQSIIKQANKIVHPAVPASKPEEPKPMQSFHEDDFEDDEFHEDDDDDWDDDDDMDDEW